MHIGIKEEIYYSVAKWISDFRFQRGPFYPLSFKFVTVSLLSLKPLSWAAPDKVVNLLKVIFGISIFQFNCLLSSAVTSFYKVQQPSHLWQCTSICLYSRTLNQQTIFLNISNFPKGDVLIGWTLPVIGMAITETSNIRPLKVHQSVQWAM